MIYGENIRLRAPERSDIPLFVDWFNDPEVREGIMMVFPMSEANEEEWFENMIKRPVAEQVLVIEIRQEDWYAIGTCGFHNLDWRIRASEVGIAIGEKSQWNKGYGTEVMRLLLRHGFETLNLNRIALHVFDINKRAIRAYEKAGFKREGVQRDAMYLNGKYVDVIIMSVLRKEWQG